MKRIVILGAKPGAIIPPSDAIYAANASFKGHEQAFGACRERVVVASSMVLAKGLDSASTGDGLYREKLEAVRDCGASRIVLFADPGRRNRVDRILADLTTHNAAPVTTVVSVRERTNLVQRISGMRYPLVDRSFFSQPFGVQLRDATEIAGYWLNRLTGDGMKDVRGKYRPSTGLLSLLLAIADNGEAAAYVISGIGMSNRNVFLTNGVYRFNRNNTDDVLPRHTQADTMLLARLRHRYRISTTEPELFDHADRYVPDAAAGGIDDASERP